MTRQAHYGIHDDREEEEGREEEDLESMLARIPIENLKAFADTITDIKTRERLARATDDAMRAIGFVA